MTTDQGTGSTIDIGFKPSMDEPSKPSDYESPLRRYWCQGAGYVVRTGISKPNPVTMQPGKQWRRVEFRGALSQGDVLETTGDVWPHPFASISIFYNEPKESYQTLPGRGVSDWEALSASCRTIWEAAGKGKWDWDAFETVFGSAITDPESGQMPSKMGMRYLMARVPTLLTVPPNETNAKWHDEVADAWQIVEIEGLGKAGGEAAGFDLKEYMVAMMDGKTIGAFMAEASEDEKIMANGSVVDQLTGGTFIDTMKGLGAITVGEDGVIHRA